MARRSTVCTQADITRLIKAALAAGVGKDNLVGVKLTRDGATLLFGEQKPVTVEAAEPLVGLAVVDDSWSDVDAT